MFDRIESPPPIYTRSSSLRSSNIMPFVSYDDFAPPKPYFRQEVSYGDLPKRSVSLSKMPSSSSIGPPRTSSIPHIPEKTHTPFNELF